MKKAVVTALALSFSASAFAQTATVTEYYVVRDPVTKKCTIVDQRPTGTTTTIGR